MRLYIIVLFFFFQITGVFSQSYLSSSVSVYYSKYRSTNNFDYSNISKSLALTYLNDIENSKISFYTGLRYYREKTKTNCVSFSNELNLDFPSYFFDDVTCEYKRYSNIQNLSLQLAGGYRVLARNNFKFLVFIENNIIVYETSQNIYETTPNSPNVIDTRSFGDYFESWLEPYIIPTISFNSASLYTDLGLSYGVRDFNFDKTLLGLKISIGVRL